MANRNGDPFVLNQPGVIGTPAETAEIETLRAAGKLDEALKIILAILKRELNTETYPLPNKD